MKRRVLIVLVALVLATFAGIWHERVNIYCRLFPDSCLTGVWEVAETMGNANPLQTTMFNVLDFDARDWLLVYSDGVCAGPGHRYGVRGGQLWLLPWDGEGRPIAASENPERLRVKFDGMSRVEISTLAGDGVVRLILRRKAPHLYSEPMEK